MFLRAASVSLSAVVALSSSALAQPATPLVPDNLPAGMPQIVEEFDRTATDAMKNPNDVGYTLGVVTRDGLAWTKSYGFSDAARQSPASADTVYGIGANALTAIMLLQLVRDGKVHFSDPVERYVPELKSVHAAYPDAAPVTLLQLSIQTSGLVLPAADVATYGKGAGAWEETLLAALPHAIYEFEPGTHAALSNIGDAILALALGRAAHQPYAEYVKQRVLSPLGMTHSSFSIAGSGNTGLGYKPAVYTTIGDLARLAQFEMLGGPDSVLSRDDLQENYRRTWVVNSVAVPNPSEGFGVGFHGETWSSKHYYFISPIGFGGPGYDAGLWFEPRTHAGVILLHQGSASALGQMIHTYVYTLNALPIDGGRQDPAQPLPYREENVTFENSAAAITLAGTLTLPQGKGPFPGVVLIPKSGPLDRDERILNHRPFLVLSDYLTRRGIAVLRTDVRGVGKSGGRFAGQTDDTASDADAALAYLKTRAEVDPHMFGLIGHGEGGLAAPIVAARNSDVAFVVLMGAPAVPGADNTVESTRLNAEGNGEIYYKAEEQAAAMRAILTVLKEEKDAAARDRKLREHLTGRIADAQMAAQIRQLTSPAFERQLTYDPATELRRLACPVLALYGEKDLSVPAALNLPVMRKALEASGTRKYEVEEVPDVNFLFQTADVGIGREANWTEETISPLVLKRIGDWVLSVRR